MNWSHFFNSFFVGLIALSISVASAAPADRRIALVIGNSSYQNVSQLPNPANDSRSIAQFFRDINFDMVVEKTDLGTGEFLRALREFTALVTDADIAIVYYAGHGIEIGGTNYLVPVDGKLATDLDVADEAVSLDRVLAAIEPARKLRLVILDSCRDNPFIPKMRRISRTRSIGRGLSEVDLATRDTLVAFAAKAGSTAEDGAGNHSPFTNALMSSLGIPGVDLRIAFGLVRDKVLKSTNNRQEPWLYGTLGGNIVALVPGPKNFGSGVPVMRPPISSPEDTPEIDFSSALKSNTREAWEVFIRMYPSGPLTRRAREKLALLAPAPSTVAKPATAAADNSANLGSQINKDVAAQLMYSPWMKVCGKRPETKNKQVCVLTKDGRLENGMPVAIVQLFEPEGEAKVLRVTVPLGMQLQHGTRMIIDQGQPVQSPYKICFPVGCMADYPVTDDMIGKMRKGQLITIQAINMQGRPISLPLPLNDFAKAYDGPPTDPKVVEEQQRKLQEELQKRAEDARKKLEAHQPTAQAPAGTQKK